MHGSSQIGHRPGCRIPAPTRLRSLIPPPELRRASQPDQPDLASTLLIQTRNQDADTRQVATEKHQVLSLNMWGAVATRVCGNYWTRRDTRSGSAQSYVGSFLRFCSFIDGLVGGSHASNFWHPLARVRGGRVRRLLGAARQQRSVVGVRGIRHAEWTRNGVHTGAVAVLNRE